MRVGRLLACEVGYRGLGGHPVSRRHGVQVAAFVEIATPGGGGGVELGRGGAFLRHPSAHFAGAVLEGGGIALEIEGLEARVSASGHGVEKPRA
eukprot:11974306-Alexandrium_andersonii.AAC.1